MVQRLRQFLGCKSGNAAIEYSLLGSLIAVGMVAGATLVGTAMNQRLNSLSEVVGSPQSEPGQQGSGPPSM